MQVSIETKGLNWDALVRRYRKAADQTALVSAGVIQWAQDKGMAEARRNLDAMVYNAPLPRSAGPNYRRTGKTRRAVSKDPIVRSSRGATGTIRVRSDIANREGFYYPFILNRGISGTRYYPRPFWTATVAMMRAQYKLRGRDALKQLQQKLSIR